MQDIKQKEAQELQQLQKQQSESELARMHSELKKELKRYSKNELIRIIGINLVQLHQTQEYIKTLLAQLNPTEAQSTNAQEEQEKKVMDVPEAKKQPN